VSDHPRPLYGTLLLVSALTIMSGATIAPALPGIEAAFADHPQAALYSRLVLTIPALSISAVALAAGALIDRVGRRRPLVAAMFLYAISGSAGLFLDTLPALLGSRLVLGIAVGFIMTISTALAGDYFTGQERTRFMGWQSAFVGLGGLLFLTGGGLLAGIHWRASFGIYGLALLLIPAILAYLPEPVREGADSSAGRDGGGGATRVAVLGAIYGIALVYSVLFFVLPTQLPFLLDDLGVGGPRSGGAALGLSTLCAAVSSLSYGRLRRTRRPLGIFLIAFALMTVGYTAISRVGTLAWVFPAMVVTGAGMGLVQPNIRLTVLGAAAEAVRGRASGGLTLAIFVGQFLSPLASQPWVEARGLGPAFGDAGLGFLVLGAVSAAASWVVRSRTARKPGHGTP